MTVVWPQYFSLGHSTIVTTHAPASLRSPPKGQNLPGACGGNMGSSISLNHLPPGDLSPVVSAEVMFPSYSQP